MPVCSAARSRRLLVAASAVFALGLIALGCQPKPSTDPADYEDEFLLTVRQQMSDGRRQETVRTRSLIHTRLVDEDGEAWMKSSVPWLNVDANGGSVLDSSTLDPNNDREGELLALLESGTLTRIESDGGRGESRPGDPALYERIMARMDQRLGEELLNDLSKARLMLPEDPRPGDEWDADTASLGLPEARVRYRVIDRDADRVLVASTLEGRHQGHSFQAQGRTIARLPTGMPEAALLSHHLDTGEGVTLRQRMALYSQRHFQGMVTEWGLDRDEMSRLQDGVRQQLEHPDYQQPEQRKNMEAGQQHQEEALRAFPEGQFFRVEGQQVMLDGDTTLFDTLWTVTPRLRSIRSDGPGPTPLLNRLAESRGIYAFDSRYAEPGHTAVLLPVGAEAGALRALTLEAELEWLEPDDAVVVRRGEKQTSEPLSITRWDERRVDLDSSGGHWAWAVPLDEDGDPLPHARVSRPPRLDKRPRDPAAQEEWFVASLALSPQGLRDSYLTETPIAALRLIPLRPRSESLTLAMERLPDQEDSNPPGLRHASPTLPRVDDQLDGEALVEALEVSGTTRNRLQVSGPATARLCRLTLDDNPDYQGTPLRFLWREDNQDTGFTPPPGPAEQGLPAAEGHHYLATEDREIEYFYDRELLVRAHCPERVESVTVTRESPGCVDFQGDNQIRMNRPCDHVAELGIQARDRHGLVLQPLTGDGDEHRFWGRVDQVEFLRRHGQVQREFSVPLPALPQ